MLQDLQLQGLVESESFSTVCCSIREWKKILRRAKKQHTVERLEEASELTWTMTDLNTFLDNKRVWSFIDNTIKIASRRDRHVRTGILTQVSNFFLDNNRRTTTGRMYSGNGHHVHFGTKARCSTKLHH